jgi:hypothetical protein
MAIPIRSAAIVFGLALVSPALASGQPVEATGWVAVDHLAAGTPVTVTLESGARRRGRLASATSEQLIIESPTSDGVSAPRRVELKKSEIASVVERDPWAHPIRWGAMGGVAMMVALQQAVWRACGKGCENDVPNAAVLVAAGVGAGIGSLVGYAADRDAGQGELIYPAQKSSRWTNRANQYFPARPNARVGFAAGTMRMQTSKLDGALPAYGFATAVQLSPHMSAHVEFIRSGGAFRPSPGSVSSEVLQNVVPAASRAAGWSRGIESRQVRWYLSELVGIHPPTWGRVRLELLGGLSVQARVAKDYYDAWVDSGTGTASDPRRSTALPGKYYILDFESPEVGMTLGLGADIAAARNVSVVPILRYQMVGDPAATVSYGAGLLVRF